ncbi:hypothetical protein CL619_00960 [archaeon]|nr:hypothetical protein [archaeon]
MAFQFIPKHPYSLYHATCTGENNENLKIFVKEGINPSRALGHGQGTGFYMWTTRKQAIEHLRFIKRENKMKGYPMLVRVRADLNPKE